MNTPDTDALPLLPASQAFSLTRSVYTSDDMREYARTALAAQAEAHAAEIDNWKTWGVIEVAIRNPCVAESMRHWEGRAEKAEAEVERLTAEREALSLLLGDVASALEYHQDQTRPIHSTKVALDAYRAARTGSKP